MTRQWEADKGKGEIRQKGEDKKETGAWENGKKGSGERRD